MSAGKSCSRFITFVSFCHTMHLLRALCNWKVNPFAFHLTPWSIVWSLSSLMWPRVAAVMRNTFRSWTQNVRCYSCRWFLKGMSNLSKEPEGIKVVFVLCFFSLSICLLIPSSISCSCSSTSSILPFLLQFFENSWFLLLYFWFSVTSFHIFIFISFSFSEVYNSKHNPWQIQYIIQ